MQAISSFQPVCQASLKAKKGLSRQRPVVLSSISEDTTLFTGKSGWRHRYRWAALTLAAATALPVSACGGSSLPSEDPSACVVFTPSAQDKLTRTPQFPKNALC